MGDGAALGLGDGAGIRGASGEDRIVRRGYGVGFGPNGHWYFFEDIAPALAFGRAARMSLECSGYGVFQAAHELQFCLTHNADEVEHLKRFVQGVKEHPWSSNWHPPAGYITAFNNGRPAQTKRRSLPL
ncbi:hypothetical protein GCM10010399_82250 [Dactylosporangium fulvum]